MHPRRVVLTGLLLCLRQPLPPARSHSLRADVSRGLPHVGLNKFHDPDSAQRTVEAATAENDLKQPQALARRQTQAPRSRSGRGTDTLCTMPIGHMTVYYLHAPEGGSRGEKSMSGPDSER